MGPGRTGSLTGITHTLDAPGATLSSDGFRPLAAAHPGQVRTVVAQKPPLTEYLPAADDVRTQPAGVRQPTGSKGCSRPWAHSYRCPG